MNVLAFLHRHGIDYSERGKRRGWVQIRCPLCGDADPGTHMGLRLNGKGYSCWRNPRQHSGTDIATLIPLLIGCSAEEAHNIAHGESEKPSDSELFTRLQKQLGGDTMVVEEVHTSRPPVMPKAFKSLNNGSPFATPFLNYLKKRGYSDWSIAWLVDTYDLRYCVSASASMFANRIIIPVHDRRGTLQTWTGRSIKKNEELRYFSLPVSVRDWIDQVALCATKDTLLNLPLLWTCKRPEVLVLVEGPFDATWFTYTSRSFGVYATCLFGLNLSEAQSELILQLRQRFSKVVLLLDAAASRQSFRIANSGLDIQTYRLNEKYKDPAELPPEEIIRICIELTSG